MKMLNCIKCGNSIPNDSAFCPFCGEKVVHRSVEVSNESANEVAMPADPTNIEAVLKRAFIFLEDGLFDKADRYLEIVLDQDPENAKAYVGKLLVSLNLNNQEQLSSCFEDFENNGDYKKSLRYADDELFKILTQYSVDANKLREEKRKEEELVEVEKKNEEEGVTEVEMSSRAFAMILLICILSMLFLCALLSLFY